MKKFLIVLMAAASAMAAVVSESPVSDAVMRGDKAALQSLIQKKADLNIAQGDGMTALHWAAYQNNVELARLLLKAGANPKVVTRLDNITPLFLAARSGNAQLIGALLEAGADANTANSEGSTPLMMAAMSGDTDSVKMLLLHGADVNAKENVRGQTALMFAASKNRGPVITLLLSKGADAKVQTKLVRQERMRFDPDGNLIPEPPAAPEPPADAPKTATATPPPPGGGRGGNAPRREFGATQMGGMTALLYAARDNNFEAVKALAEGGVDLNEASGSEHLTPMLMALVNGRFDIAKYLLDKGADPNLTSQQELAPLYAVIDVQWSPHAWYPEPIVGQEKVNYLDLMADMIAKGANVNVRLGRKPWYRTTSHDATWIDPSGATAFWRAAQATDIAAMKLLLDHGADPNIASLEGVTPLMAAAGLGWGWNFSVGAADGWLAATSFLLDHKLDVNTVDAKGNTALHGAAYVGDNALVKFLVDHGAKVDVKNKAGDSVADMANGPNRFGIPHPETVALLEKLGSPNQHNCRSDQCLVAPTDEKKPVSAVPIPSAEAKQEAEKPKPAPQPR